MNVVQVRVASRSILPPWGSFRFRPALRVRVVSQTKSRKIPTRIILPVFAAADHVAPALGRAHLPGQRAPHGDVAGEPSRALERRCMSGARLGPTLAWLRRRAVFVQASQVVH